MNSNQISSKDNSNFIGEISNSIFRYNPENRIAKTIFADSKVDLLEKILIDIVRLTGESKLICHRDYEQCILDLWEGKGTYSIDCQYYGFGEGVSIDIEYTSDNYENY